MSWVSGSDRNPLPCLVKVRKLASPLKDSLGLCIENCLLLYLLSLLSRTRILYFDVQVYNTFDSTFKLHEVFEFIGVYSFDKEQASLKEGPDEPVDSLVEDELTSLPSCKVLNISVAKFSVLYLSLS